MPTVNCPMYCLDCMNVKYEGTLMVGTDATGGGPEPAYSCRKDKDMEYFWYNGVSCPFFDNGMDS